MNEGQLIYALVKSECKVYNLTREYNKVKKELSDLKKYVEDYMPPI